MGVVATQLQILDRAKIALTQVTLAVDAAGTFTVSVIAPGTDVVEVATGQTAQQVATLVGEFTTWVTDGWGTP